MILSSEVGMQKFDKDKIFRTTTRALFFAAVAVLFGGALLSDYGGDGYLHPACLWTAVEIGRAHV